jgi:hypothetical protein
MNGVQLQKVTVEDLKRNRPDLVQEIGAAALARDTDERAAQAAEAERERILAIDALAIEGHDDLVAAAKADGTTTAGQLAEKILRARKDRLAQKGRAEAEARAAHLRAREADDAAVAVDPMPGGLDRQDDLGADGAGGADAERAEAEWRRSAKLRAEFGSVESYVAFRKAQSRGSVRVLRRSANDNGGRA